MTTPTTPDAILDRLQRAAPGDLNEHLRHVVSWSKDAPQGDLSALLDGVAHSIESRQERGSLFALMLQYVTLPEEGVPDLVARMLDVLESSTPEALAFLDALSHMTLPEGTDPDAMQPDDLDELMAQQRQRIAQAHPSSAAAAQHIKNALSAALGVLERDRRALRAARASSRWAAALSAVAPMVDEARMTRTLLECFDEQPVLCVALDTGTTWTLKIDGVTDLKQLHALLIHALVKPLDEDALSIADGSGPHFNGSWVQGQWTFWSTPDAAEPLTEEGALARLPRIVWQGTEHVVVCVRAAQTYESWTLMRTFDMPASVEVLERCEDEAQVDAIVGAIQAT